MREILFRGKAIKCPVGVIKANIQDILEEIVGDME